MLGRMVPVTYLFVSRFGKVPERTHCFRGLAQWRQSTEKTARASWYVLLFEKGEGTTKLIITLSLKIS